MGQQETTKLTKFISGEEGSPFSTVDKRLYDMVFAEAGGGTPEEIMAVGSVFLNRVREQGYEKALKGSSAYNKRSKQYMKASTGELNKYEKGIYDRNEKLLRYLISNPSEILPYHYFENVKAYGDPFWSKGKEFRDIGRQRFYKK